MCADYESSRLRCAHSILALTSAQPPSAGRLSGHAKRFHKRLLEEGVEQKTIFSLQQQQFGDFAEAAVSVTPISAPGSDDIMLKCVSQLNNAWPSAAWPLVATIKRHV